MAPSKVDQATLLVLDIGRNVSEPEEKNGKSFFEHAKDCTARIIERKIISQGKNLLGIILLGSKKSENNFKHIYISEKLQAPTWQMVRDLPQMATKYKGNWFDALLVAADHFKNGISGVNISNKKIILMTNFQASSHLEQEDIEQVFVLLKDGIFLSLLQALTGFKDEGFEVDIIGPELYAEENKNVDIQLARQFIEATKGSTATFEYTMRYLLFHRKKAVSNVPWNVDLSIGPNIKIPVSAYIRIKDEPVVKNWMKAVKDSVTNTVSTSEGVLRSKIHVNTENQDVVQFSNVIKGYQYGGQVIPFSDCDKSMLYDSGQKSLCVYGFTSTKNITWHHLNGDGLSYVFGRKGDKKAQNAIRCLVECLYELDLVAVVRRVYNNGNAPKMMVLLPVIDANNYICLSMIGVCFKDDLKNMMFPPTNTKKYDCTDEQVNAFKDLIKAMDLTKAYEESEYDDTEAFPIAEMVSPSSQYVLDCIAFRAMNPEKPLPQPRDDIIMLFKVPPLILKRSREPLEKLKNHFVLNKVEIKRKDRKRKLSSADLNALEAASTSNEYSGDQMLNEMPKIHMNIIKKVDEIERIGTLHPIDDFNTLKRNGTSVNKLIVQMTEAIENMVYRNIDGNFTKAMNSIAHLRNECVETFPSEYNNWLKQFKLELTDRNKNDIANLIAERNLNYILESENSLSTYKSAIEDDSQLYENDTVPNLTGITINSEVNDLFDNM